jgi:hypothetical protein
MKFRHQACLFLPAVVLTCGTLTASAQAQFTQQGPKLVGTGAISGSEGGALQGSSVSVSGDGNAAVVGGEADNSFVGAAWVYTRSGAVWTQQGPKLVAADFVGQAEQGFSASVSGDGNTAIVGGPSDNNPAVGNTGAAWVYTRSDGQWTQQGPKLVAADAVGFAFQGFSVSVSGDGSTAIVGGWGDNNFNGAAWVYTRSAGVWTQQAKLVAADAIGPPTQGSSVSLSSDGNTAIVGGPNDNDAVGAAWVFTRSDGVWSQQAKLVGTDAIGAPPQAQGSSVSLSADGNTAIVGGPTASKFNIGGAWVFTRSGGVWTQQGPKLVGTNIIGSFARQGDSVSLSADGNTTIVGGSTDNSFTGAAWVFTRSDDVWSQQAKLVGTDAVGTGRQGGSVSLSRDGNYAMVGGPFDNSSAGAAWVYARFAGTPGTATCVGASVRSLTGNYRGFLTAAKALGFSGVPALQNAIFGFCSG